MREEIIREFRTQTLRRLVELGIPDEILTGVETSTLMRNAASQYAEKHFTSSERLRLENGMNKFLLEYELAWAKNSKIFPDTIHVLKMLHDKGIRMAIVTNTSRQAAETILARHNLSEYFTTMITRDDVKRLKPDPQGVFLAMDRTGDKNAWFIGDMPIDSEAARNAGIKSIIVKREWPAHLVSFTFEGDYTVESLSEALTVFQRYNFL
jgi:HAD superfamily hydrolase (TIGR01549 family)